MRKKPMKRQYVAHMSKAEMEKVLAQGYLDAGTVVVDESG